MENRDPRVKLLAQTTFGRLVVLVSAGLVLAAVCGPIAWGIFGSPGILAVGISVVCCLVPGCVLFLLAPNLIRGSALLNLMLAGMAGRAVCCLAGFAVMEGVLQLQQTNYLIWISISYVSMLALETKLLSQAARWGSSSSQEAVLKPVSNKPAPEDLSSSEQRSDSTH